MCSSIATKWSRTNSQQPFWTMLSTYKGCWSDISQQSLDNFMSQLCLISVASPCTNHLTSTRGHCISSSRFDLVSHYSSLLKLQCQMLINRAFTWQWKWRWEMKSEVQFCLLMWKLGPVISSYWVIINKSLHTYNTWHSLAIFLFVYLHFSRPSCPKLTLYNMTMWGHCSFQNVCAVCELLPPVVFPYTPVQQNHLPRDGGSILEQTKKTRHVPGPTVL